VPVGPEGGWAAGRRKKGWELEWVDDAE
jgi:hypothetical protein